MRLSLPWLETFVEIYSLERPEAELKPALAHIHELQYQLSNRYPGSPLVRLNREGHSRPVPCPPALKEALSVGIELHAATGGRMNICSGKPRLPCPAQTVGDPLWIEFLGDARVWLVKPMRIDLSCLMEAFIADRAWKVLHASGLASGTVKVGGRIYFGARSIFATSAM